MATSLKRVWSSPSFRRWGIVLIIFLIAFVLRVIYPVDRPLVWTDRAFHFIDAIAEQDWPHTFQRYHPGVTIMWLSGMALHLYSQFSGGLTADQILGLAPIRPGALTEALQAAVVPVTLVIAACIALTYPLMRRLAGRRIALVGALLLALDPFYIGYSKVVHPDALLATFMIVSVLFLLVYLKEGRWPMLLFSGLFGGLSLLSKSPSVFLLPYLGLVLATSFLAQWHRNGWKRDREHWLRAFGYVIRTFLVWIVVAGAVFIVLWPAMWVRPLETIQAVIGGIIHHRTVPHKNPVFFNDQIFVTDPGIGYYLATIAWKTTAVTLPSVIAAIFFAFRRFRLPSSWPLWALLAYVFFFTLQMAISEFKQLAYILPVFPALDLIAAYGLVWTTAAVAQLRPFERYKRLGRALLAAALVLQAIITLASYPYFAAHDNRLLGGTSVARHILPMQDQGEGLEVAARFLNALPHGQDETAMLYGRSAIVFQRVFEGRTATEITPLARYRIYYINALMRELGGEEWDKLWQEDRQNEPLFTVDVNGQTFVWVYGEPPEDPAPDGPRFEPNARVGENIYLKRARFSSDSIAAGSPLVVVLEWQAGSEVAGDYTVFTHLLSADHELAAQKDNVPLLGIRPTYTWRAGETLEDSYIITTDSGLTPGTYSLSVGMYDTETLQRLPAFDGAGNRLPEDRIVIGEVQVVGDDSSTD